MRRKKWIAVGLTLGALLALTALSFAALGASGPGAEEVDEVNVDPIPVDPGAEDSTIADPVEEVVTYGSTTMATIKNPDAPPPATDEPVEVDVHCEVAADGSWGFCDGYIDPAMIPAYTDDKD